MGLDPKEISAASDKWFAAVLRAKEGGLVPGEAVFRAAERLGASTRPLYLQLLLPVAQLEGGEAITWQYKLSDILSLSSSRV